MLARDIVTATFGYVNDFEGEDKTRASPNVTHLTTRWRPPPTPLGTYGWCAKFFHVSELRQYGLYLRI